MTFQSSWAVVLKGDIDIKIRREPVDARCPFGQSEQTIGQGEFSSTGKSS